MPSSASDRPPERLLAIDFGEKRVGLAIWDSEAGLALPHGVLVRSSDHQVISEIASLARAERISFFVLGDPRGPEGRAGAASRRVLSFGRKLAAATGLCVELVDETLTSHEAAWRLAEPGVSKRRRQPQSDAIAAQVLLEEFLAGRDGPGAGERKVHE